jgi:phenazine biosynthesis protein phzE
MKQTLLDSILKSHMDNQPFALLYRPHITGTNHVEVILGEINYYNTIGSVQLPKDLPSSYKSTLIVIPYRQLNERGFEYVEDNERLINIMISEHDVIPKNQVLMSIPSIPIELFNGRFDIGDEEYIEIVRKIISAEIGTGEGSNFVIKRDLMIDIKNYSPQSALRIFRNLIENERGAHWVFLINTCDRIFVGASPELHIALNSGIVMMNPISGTYRYPQSGPTIEGLIEFLSSLKETDELYMVLEEELKMLSEISSLGGKIHGPFLREMSRVAHTEFYIKGKTQYDPKVILLKTLFSPAVTGSPIENACRVIKRYEQRGRGYYAGVVALLSKDASGENSMDSTILIRTADINTAGCTRIGVGATIVRHSDPIAEAAETRAKATALLQAMGYKGKYYV